MTTTHLTVICLNSHKTFQIPVNTMAYYTATQTAPSSDDNWQAYLTVQNQLKDGCEKKGVSFWQTKEGGWSSEL